VDGRIAVCKTPQKYNGLCRHSNYGQYHRQKICHVILWIGVMAGFYIALIGCEETATLRKAELKIYISADW
jgi:hypothetical protein